MGPVNPEVSAVICLGRGVLANAIKHPFSIVCFNLLAVFFFFLLLDCRGIVEIFLL